MFINSLREYKNQEITLKGWIYNFRSSGAIMFLQMRDGTGFCQCILNKKDVSEEKWNEAQKIAIETSIELSGLVTEHPKHQGEFELQVKNFKIYQIPSEEYPISKKEHGPEFLLDNRHLWLRSSKQRAIQVVRDSIIHAIYDFFRAEGFTKIDAPILTPNACEGTTDLFEIDYFGKPAYLTQSGQLYLEAAIFSVGKCYDFGPVFRAEKSKTRRHLNEFWMMDAEMPFCDQKMNENIQEDLLCSIVEYVLKNNKKELEILERDTAELYNLKRPFHRMKHKDAVKKMKELGLSAEYDDDFGAEAEIEFANSFDRPVFIEDYPAKVKAFYMKRAEDDADKARCADLLVPGLGEIFGGSQREDDYEILLGRIKEHNLPVEPFNWYLDLRKFGSVPHSGFGLGLERVVSWICGTSHVRETIPFPRVLNRV